MKPGLLKAQEEVRRLAEKAGADSLYVVTDSHVAALTEGFLQDTPRIIIEAGEENKSIASAEMIWAFLSDHGATRRSMIVNIGGGMVTDLGGFAAATFKRGIGYVNLATTLLGAVDASVGGKTGVNFNGLKNEIGAFRLPVATLALTDLFSTLTREEWLSGCGEVLKTAILYGEKLYRLAISEAFIVRRESEVVREVVEKCRDFKLSVVMKDVEDRGIRRILNFGHTYGHALEALMMEKGRPLPHGIAVAHGIEYALRLGEERNAPGSISAKDYREVLCKYFPEVELDAEDDERLRQLMGHDKKNFRAGEPAFVLPEDIESYRNADSGFMPEPD